MSSLAAKVAVLQHAAASIAADTTVSLAQTLLCRFAAVQLRSLKVSDYPADEQASLQRVTEELVASVKRAVQKQGDGLEAAITLLGGLCSECSDEVFLQHYAEWSQLLYDNLSKDCSMSVRQAVLSSCTTLFTRLQDHASLSGVKREGGSFASKFCTRSLQYLQDSGSGCELQALELLRAVLLVLPAGARQVAAQLERVLSGCVAAVPSPPGCRHAAALALAALPRASGDAATWSSAARRLLVSAHDVLDVLFMGLEPQPELAQQARSALMPDGQRVAGMLPQLPTQLEALLQVLSALLTCLVVLLSTPFQVPAPLPGAALLMLTRRLLAFDDGAVAARGVVPHSTSMFAGLCAALPALHAAAWQLQSVTLRAGRGALMPLQGSMTQLLGQHLRRCRLLGARALAAVPPATRLQMYSFAEQLLVQGGLATARQLAGDILDCCMVELYGAAPSTSGQAGSGTNGPARKKAKLQAAAPLVTTALDPTAHSSLQASPRDLPAQAAALQLLSALLAAAGAVLPANLRAQADSIAAHAAGLAGEAALHLRRTPVAPAAGQLAGVQQAAYSCLVTSQLAPWGHRPPYLSQAISLLRDGRSGLPAATQPQSTLAAVYLEALLHPRSTAMSATQQYLGMDEVPPLTRPRFWSAVDASAPAAGSANGHPAAPTMQPQLNSPHAAAAPLTTTMENDPTPSSTFRQTTAGQENADKHPPQQQAQFTEAQLIEQRMFTLLQLAPTLQSAISHAAGDMGGVAAAVVGQADGVKPPEAAATYAHAAVQASVQQLSGTAAVPVLPRAQQKSTHLATQPLAGGVSTAAYTAGGSRGGVTTAVVSTAFGHESEDSEGPLPEIDSGEDSDMEAEQQ